MKTHHCDTGMMFLIISVMLFISWSPACAAEDRYVTVHLDGQGRGINHSAAQTVNTGDWSRFHLAFGNQRSQIGATRPGKLEDPPATSFMGDEGMPDFTASVTVQFLDRQNDGYKIRVIIQTATRLDHGSDRNVHWSFTREEDTTSLPFNTAHEFSLFDPNSQEQLNYALTIETEGESNVGRRADEKQLPTSLKVQVNHQLIEARGSAEKTHLRQDRSLSESEDHRTWRVEFQNVVHLAAGDSCYHYVTLTVEDLEIPANGRRMYGMLKVDRHTVFGSDSPLEATSFSADLAYVDDFERRIRLRKGKPIEIRIPPEENERFPFPAWEVFTVTATW